MWRDGADDEHEGGASDSAGSRARQFVPPTLLFLLAVAVRALPIYLVYLPGHVQFFGLDPWYHMRRIVYSIRHFPAVLDFDPYINFPDGARAIWTPLFDWTIAAFVWVIDREITLSELEYVAVWVAPILGGATVLALYFTARRHFGEPVARLSGALLCVFSGHFWYSQIGFVDHHAAVALVTTLLLASVMLFLQRASLEPQAFRAGLSGYLGLGVMLGTSLLLWPGSLLHVGLAEMGLLACLLTRPSRSHARSVAVGLGVAHAAAFCVVAPFGIGSDWPQWGAFSPVVLSNFQPWLFGAAATFCLVCAWLWKVLARAGESPTSRSASAAIVAVVVLLVSLALWPGILATAGDAWEWFAKTDDFQNLVAESAPLFTYKRRPSVYVPLRRLSAFVFLVPVALIFAFEALRRSPRPGPALFYLGWTLALCVATVLQKRFMNSASVAIALLLALSLRGVYRALPERVIGMPRGRTIAKLSLAALTLCMLAPMLLSYAPYASTFFQERKGDRQVIAGTVLHKYAMVMVAKWIRINTPRTSGWMDARVKPEYGIVAPWGLGHVLEYVGRRPTANTNFGDDIGSENFLRVRRYYLSSEQKAIEVLGQLRGRYVVAQGNSIYLGESPDDSAMFYALHRNDGSEFVPEGARVEAPIPALHHHRLVHESIAQVRKPEVKPFFKVWEVVRGALVSGRARPGSEIRLSLPVRTNRGRPFVYASRTTADAEGRYEIRVPYSNQSREAGVQVAGSYLLACGQEEARVQIHEKDVRRGLEVAGPELCLKASGAPDEMGATGVGGARVARRFPG